MKPSNIKLYEKTKQEVKNMFKVWPSAYASAYLVKLYKARGGKYIDDKSPINPRKSPINRNKGLTRWFDEVWIDVCQLPKIVRCGRPKSVFHNYPYCRPMKKITNKSPRTVYELSTTELRRRCKQKRKSPMSRIY